MTEPIEWPRPWRDDPGAPEGARELLRSIERPPFAPPAIRHAPSPPPRTRWLGPTLATAAVLGGLVIWRLAPVPIEAPRVERVDEPAAAEPLRPAPASLGLVADAGLAPVVPPPVDELLGALTVTCASRATVYVDGAAVGTTPLEELRLPPGRYEVMVDAGRGSVTRRVGVRAGATSRVGCSAPRTTAVAPTGRLTVQSIPWTQVWVDGTPRGATPLLDLVLPAGEHTLRFENAAQGIHETRTVTIEPDETLRLRLSFEPGVPDEGVLVIQTLPWARVFVDGRDTGRSTPVRSLRVPAGHHRIGLRTPDGTMHELEVTVEPGEMVRVVRDFGRSGASSGSGERPDLREP